MQTQPGEHEDITKLLRDAFVRICQLAVADCGLSFAELTLHLSVQVNTGVPQVLSTTVVETVRSPPAKETDHTEYSVASGSEALNESRQINDNNSSNRSDGEESFAVDRSFGSSVHIDDAESRDFNRTVASGSVPSSCSRESAFTAATDSQLMSSPVDVNNVHGLILSEDCHGEVPLDELLADVEKSNDCDEYVVSDSPVALLDIGENNQEGSKVYGRSRTSLSTLVSSEDSLVAVNGACVLSTLQSCDSDVLTRCIGTDCADSIVYSSDRQCNTGNQSFLQHCHFGEQDTVRSNSAFRDLTEVAGNTLTVDELSASDGTEIEADGLPTSRHSSLYGNTADRSDRNDTSYEDELVVDESGTRSCHIAATESSSTSLCSTVSTAGIGAAAALLKPYTTTHLLSTVGTDQQPNIMSIGQNSYRLITMTADNTSCDAQGTEFQKIFSLSAAVRDSDQGRCYFHVVLDTKNLSQLLQRFQINTVFINF